MRQKKGRRDLVRIVDRKAEGRDGPGRWQAWVRDTAAHRYIKKGFNEKRDAEQWAHETAAKVALGLTSAEKVSMALALDRHLARLGERERSGRHVAEIATVIAKAIEAGITDLRADNVAAKAAVWLDRLDVSPSTRARYKRHLIAVGRTAMRWWPTLTRDPFLALGGEGSPLPAPESFTVDEARTLVSDAALGSEIGRMACLALYTGLRMREASWMRWDRVDLHRKLLDVIPPTDAEKAQGAAVKRDKARTVPLQPELVRLLTVWFAEAGDAPLHMFPSLWRSHVSNLGEWFQDHLVALGIDSAGSRKRRTFHSLRHTHAAIALASGEDGLRLRLYLGHAGPEMTAHYAQQAMRLRSVVGHWHGVWQLRPVPGVAGSVASAGQRGG